MIDSSSAAANSQSHTQWRTRSRVSVAHGWERVGRAKLAGLIDLTAMFGATAVYGLSTSSDRVLAGGYVVAYVALVFALLAFNGIYRQRMANSALNEFRTIVIATGLAAALLTFATRLVTSGVPIAHQSARLWVLSAVCLVIGRGALRAAEVTRWRRGQGGHATLILGAGKVGHLIARRLLDKPEIGLRPVGFVDDTPMQAVGETDVPILGPESELESVVVAHGVEHAILSFSAAPHERTLAAARRLDELGVTVSLVPRLFEGIPDRTVLDRVAGIPVISVYPTDPRGWQLSIKYAAERVIAGLGLVVLAPVLALGALAVRLDLGRPILFRQRRVGIDGQEFEMLKFRTMRDDPSSNGQANSDWADAVLAGERGLR
ncbi:MAG TPA: sugar transferase, partial [Solirubrobacterales bacterium]|nr:sugar transferase [Solirubrobacterales bacterium]